MEAQRGGTSAEQPADLARLDVVWQQMRQRLDAEKQRIVDEIRHYPAPIPACDVQFNGLLAERAAILQEIERVNAIRGQRLTVQDHIELLDEFAQSSLYVDDEFVKALRDHQQDPDR